MSRRIANYRQPQLKPAERCNASLATMHDNSSPYDLAVEAQVRSGDFFVTLATRLDGVGQEIPEVGARASIERMVCELIYLQERYQIMRTLRS